MQLEALGAETEAEAEAEARVTVGGPSENLKLPAGPGAQPRKKFEHVTVVTADFYRKISPKDAYTYLEL